MGTSTDWQRWHDRYADPSSSLSHRLHIVQRHITGFLDARSGTPLRVLSLCAGQGRDIIEVLAGRADAAEVGGELVEIDPSLAAHARGAIAAAGLSGLTVREADAGEWSTYAGQPLADLLLLAGVLGNITDDDVRATVRALPSLCAAGATVIWTRTRQPPDLTPTVRAWFAEVGFVEQAFDAPHDTLFSVGVHHFTGEPAPRPASGRLFRFIR
jgi:hypothetical protein